MLKLKISAYRSGVQNLSVLDAALIFFTSGRNITINVNYQSARLCSKAMFQRIRDGHAPLFAHFWGG